MDLLVSADDLAELLRVSDDGGTRAPGVVVLDVRWSLQAPDGRPAFHSGHVPGAMFVDLDTDLADLTVTGQGRHPLPSDDAFTATMRRWGINEGDRVIVMDDSGNLSAARAWWLLRHAGHRDVQLLDGGLAAWVRAGHPLETGDTETAPGTATAHFGAMPTVDIDAAAALAAGDGVLLDSRAGERYRGEIEPMDPRAGHVPGAISAPTVENLDESGCFISAEGLAQRFADLGADGHVPVAAYCGSGVNAAHTVAALAIAGIDGALFPGSWSQWSNEPGRPVATGAARG